MAETSKMNLLGLVGVLGALLLIIGVFLSWADITGSVLGFSETKSISGMDIMTNNEYEFDYSYAPIIALVAGILGVIACILPVVKPLGIERILGLVSLIVAVVAVVIIYMFSGQMTGFSFEGLASASVSCGIGWTISLVGGVLVILGSIIPVLMKVTNKDA